MLINFFFHDWNNSTRRRMTTYTVFTMYKIREKMEKRKKEEKVKHGQITSDFTIACESN